MEEETFKPKIGDVCYLCNENCIEIKNWKLMKIKEFRDDCFIDFYDNLYYYAIKFEDFKLNIFSLIKANKVWEVSNSQPQLYISDSISEVIPGMLGFFSNIPQTHPKQWQFGRITGIDIRGFHVVDKTYYCFIKIEDFNQKEIDLSTIYKITPNFNQQNLVQKYKANDTEKKSLDFEYAFVSDYFSLIPERWKLQKIIGIDNQDNKFISASGSRYSIAIDATIFNPHDINISNAYTIVNGFIYKCDNSIITDKQNEYFMFSNKYSFDVSDWFIGLLTETDETGYKDACGRHFKYAIPFNEFNYSNIKF